MSVHATMFALMFGLGTSMLSFAIWFIFFRRFRHWSWRVAVSCYVALCFVVIAMWKYEWIGRWDLMMNKLLIKVSPQLVVTSAKTMGPTLYLFATWVLGFALTFQGLLIWSRRRGEMEDKPQCKT